MSDLVTTELVGGVLVVTLNRVDKKNAITQKMYGVMADAIERAQTEPGIKVVLYTGKDGVYSAGNDLADFDTSADENGLTPVARFLHNIATTDVPLLGAVDGLAVGVATTMLLHFDQVFASDRAVFSMPFVNLGLVPEAGSSKLLISQCGYQNACKLLMLGETFSAQEALSYNVVSAVTSPNALMDEALSFANKLSAKPKKALRSTKRLMRRDPETLAQTMQAEIELFSEGLASPEFSEAVAAFTEKRLPNFSQFD